MQLKFSFFSVITIVDWLFKITSQWQQFVVANDYWLVHWLKVARNVESRPQSLIGPWPMNRYWPWQCKTIGRTYWSQFVTNREYTRICKWFVHTWLGFSKIMTLPDESYRAETSHSVAFLLNINVITSQSVGILCFDNLLRQLIVRNKCFHIIWDLFIFHVCFIHWTDVATTVPRL